jgi:hypothetical protein
MFSVRYKLNFPIIGLALQVLKKLVRRYENMWNWRLTTYSHTSIQVERDADYIQPHGYMCVELEADYIQPHVYMCVELEADYIQPHVYMCVELEADYI